MGTCVRPRRHVHPTKARDFKMFPVLQGAIGLLLFDPQGDHRGPIMVQGTTYKRQSGPCTGVLELKEEAHTPTKDKYFLGVFLPNRRHLRSPTTSANLGRVFSSPD